MLLVSAALMFPGSSSAALTPTSPVNASAIATSRPTFTWSLDGDSTATLFEASSTSSLLADGRFSAPWYRTTLATDATSHQLPLTKQLLAGRWYWQVRGATAAEPDKTPLQSFTVSPYMWKPALFATSRTRGTTGTIRIKTNIRYTFLTVVIRQGGEVCMRRRIKLTRKPADIGLWNKFRIYCYPYDRLETGQYVSVVARLRGAGLSRVTAVRHRVK
jgi:hypothetical protein